VEGGGLEGKDFGVDQCHWEIPRWLDGWGYEVNLGSPV
jgi:hypothetical protein